MKREEADRIISEYMQKIYGFALSKTKNVDQAEELASIITFDVYKSLLKTENVTIVNKYIYRIASNVYARFVDQEISQNNILKQEFQNTVASSSYKDSAYELIRREISYLGKTQREIIVMHYYQKMKLKEIAQKLDLPIGTIGWHLNEARNQIEVGFRSHKESNSTYQKAGVNQIFFKEMKSSGDYGPLYTDMSFYFTTNISRSIAYSVYHIPKTCPEIANEMSIPTAYIEDEISKLVDTGFINKLPGNKYITNICIDDINPDRTEQINQIMTKYANIFCDIYMPLLKKNCDAAFHSREVKEKVHLPQNDKNFLVWTIITYACYRSLKIIDYKNDRTEFYVERKDGGHNIALATIGEQTDIKDILSPLNADLFVSSWHRVSYPISIWSYFSKYDTRMGKYKEYSAPLFAYLYDYITGHIPKELINIEKYISLFDKGLLVSKGKTEYVNMLVTTMKEDKLIAIFPPIPDKIKEIAMELDDAVFRVIKKYYPGHIRELCKTFFQNTLSGGKMRAIILENMLKNNVLKPLKKQQKMTVNMIMFSDTLPKD